MINTIKALLAGVIFIFVASMIMQLAYLFIAVGFNSVVKEYPALKEISWIFRYLLAIPAFVLIMFAGGYLTAIIAKTKVLIHSGTVGAIAMGVMMWMALQNAQLTTKGIVINLLMLVATLAGGWYWQRRKLRNSIEENLNSE